MRTLPNLLGARVAAAMKTSGALSAILALALCLGCQGSTTGLGDAAVTDAARDVGVTDGGSAFDASTHDSGELPSSLTSAPCTPDLTALSDPIAGGPALDGALTVFVTVDGLDDPLFRARVEMSQGSEIVVGETDARGCVRW